MGGMTWGDEMGMGLNFMVSFWEIRNGVWGVFI